MTELNKFTIYWRDGRKSVLEGEGERETGVANAMNRAGYGGGSVRAVDFWAPGDDNRWVWNPETRDWDLKTEEPNDTQ